MNRLQWITLLLALLNLVLVCLFPPFDYLSQSRSNVPTFDGFAWAFSERPNYIVNSSFVNALSQISSRNSIAVSIELRPYRCVVVFCFNQCSTISRNKVEMRA